METKVITKYNGLEINVLDQHSIDVAKAACPGEAVSVAVTEKLCHAIVSSEIQQISQLPGDYAYLGRVFGLPS